MEIWGVFKRAGGLKDVGAEAVSLGEGHRDTQLAGPSSPRLLCFPRPWVAQECGHCSAPQLGQDFGKCLLGS